MTSAQARRKSARLWAAAAVTPGRQRASVRPSACGWRIGWRLQPDGRTVIEVTDQDGSLAGLVASTRLPLLSVDGGWRGAGRGARGAWRWWALAIGHAPAGDGVVVTFTRSLPGRRRARRTTVHPATRDGLWVAVVAGRYTTAHCHTPAAASALRLTPVAKLRTSC
jgi:hypothetical protein